MHSISKPAVVFFFPVTSPKCRSAVTGWGGAGGWVISGHVTAIRADSPGLYACVRGICIRLLPTGRTYLKRVWVFEC